VRIRLLVDSGEFWRALVSDVEGARERVFVQSLALEGDSTGQGLAQLLRGSKAPDRRILVDSFGRFWLSDKWIHHPRHLLDGELRQERRDTEAMIAGLVAAGVPVKFVNPMGFLYRNGPRRNHKKILVVDRRVAYIGGFNFGDHNFAWRDVMLRLEDEAIADFLGEDFLATWAGRNQALSREFPGITLHLFDGRTNPARFAPLFELVDGARESIDVECAYLTPPFTGKLGEARRRGVRVRLVMASQNNWPAVHDHVYWESAQAGIDLRLFEGRMVHMKAMLVDGRALALGSMNFDFWSYLFQQEVMGIVTDPELVADFRRRVFDVDLDASRRRDGEVGELRGRLASLRLSWIENISRVFNRQA
jgi:cardiolipin synthase